MRDTAAYICAVLIFVILLCMFVASVDRVIKASEKMASPPVATEPDHTTILLGETPEGARVYRTEGPKAVVPVVFVVSKQGSVAIR